MNEGKNLLVGTLGLPEQELRLVKNMLKLTAARAQGGYDFSDNAALADCDVVIVNADDAAAMASWQALVSKGGAPLPVMVASAALASPVENYFQRPFSPIKVLALLDRLAVEIQVKKPDHQIFAGKRHAAHADSSASPAGSQIRRALVVDDSPTVRKQLELELQASNIYVDSAETGEDGLDLLEQNSYDIIFLDVVLPGADGYQVCKNIKKNPAAKQTPVVMLTSKSSPFDRVRGSLAGCDTYLTKPVDYKKFRQVLEEYKV